MFSVLRSPFSVLRSPFSVLRSPFSVLRSPVLRSPFSVLRSLRSPASHALTLSLALGFSALLMLAPSPVRAQTVSVELKFGGHLGGQTNGVNRSVPKGSTRSYTVRLASWPAGAGASVTVLIDPPSSGLVHLHKEQLVFTQSNHRKRKHVKVTGVTEGTVTVSHTIEGHPSALDASPSSVTFDVAAGKGYDCTNRAVRRHVLLRPVDGVFIPGKLDEDCAVVSEFTNQNGTYTRYAYPFEVFEYVDDEANHYAWVVLVVDAEHNIQGVSIRLRDKLHLNNNNGRLSVSRYDSIEPGETFWSYFAESRNFRKSTCGFSALETFLADAYEQEEYLDATSFGWDRGCLIDEGKTYKGIVVAQPVSMSVTYLETVYDVLIDRVLVSTGNVKFVLSDNPNHVVGYDNQALMDVFPSSKVGLDSGGALDKSRGNEYQIVFHQASGDQPPTISRPSPFPLE